MKKLILPLVLLPILAQAQEVPEISDTKIKSDFLTIVKDVEVEDQLSKTAEFNDCRKENEYKPDDTKKEEKLRKATECFKKKLPKDEAALKKLSENLQLENYGLVKSKNVSEITEYLSKKMIKSLTGNDPDKVTKESLAWKNQKIVDQKVFLDLYKNQLIKSALFEVSRYCFENLRITANSASTDFSSHWSATITTYNPSNDKPNVSIIDDLGVPSFFKLDPNTDATKTDQIYKDLVTGLSGGQQISPALYEKFFTYCQKSLPLLCDEFRKNVTSKTKDKNTGEDKSIAQDKTSKMSTGANSCLTMDKLRSIRKAMSNTDLVAKQFDEMGADKNKFALQMLENPKIYQRGKGAGEESLDELTSFSSSDMLEGANQQEDLAQLEKDCAPGGNGGSDCEKFLAVGNQLENAISNVETEMNLKREIEVKRVLALRKSKDEELKKYLEENGYFDILNDLDKLSDAELEAKIGNIFDARKVAEIEALKIKVGKRQISEKEDGDKSIDKDALRMQNITDTKEERARLAQVVMFNNIITSQLNLSKKVGDKYESAGRNTSGWTKEAKGLKASGMDETLFSGIQEIADKEGIKTDDTNIAGGGIIDMILGNKDAENAN